MPLSSCLFLSATDTTIGFLSQDSHRIDRIKKRPQGMLYIRVFPSFRVLKEYHRIPKGYRKKIRRSQRISYILPGGESFRIIHDPRHLLLLKRLQWVFSTSANLSGLSYDESYARSAADIVIEPLGSPGDPSRIFRLGKRKLRRVR